MVFNLINQVDLKREAWIDNVKLFAIICVVISHCFHYFTLEPYEDFPVRPFVNAFNMHLFAFVSGLNAFKGISRINNLQSFVKYLDKIIMRIALPGVAYGVFLNRILNRIIEKSVSGTIVWAALFVAFCVFVWFIITPPHIQQKNRIVASLTSIVSVVFKVLILVFTCSHYADWFFRFLLVTLMIMAFSALLCRSIIKKNNLIPFVLPLFLLLAFCVPVFGVSELAIVFALGFVIRALGRKISDNLFVSSILLVIGIFLFWLSFYAFGNTEHHTFYQTGVYQLIHEGIWYIFIFRQVCAISLSLAFAVFIKSLSSNYNLFSYWGARTLPIYGIHVMFVIILNRFLPVVNLPFVLFLIFSCLLGIVLTLISCIMVFYIQKSNLGKVIFGI